jgi:hypothetical protein
MTAHSEARSRPRWLLWWTLIERSASQAVHPKTDVRAADAAIEVIVAESGIRRSADRMVRSVARWYFDSYSAHAVMALDQEWTMLGRAGRIRSVGAGVVVAALTSLAVERLGSEPVGVSIQLVPVLCAVIGAIAAALAAPIARALDRSGD